MKSRFGLRSFGNPRISPILEECSLPSTRGRSAPHHSVTDATLWAVVLPVDESPVTAGWATFDSIPDFSRLSFGHQYIPDVAGGGMPLIYGRDFVWYSASHVPKFVH